MKMLLSLSILLCAIYSSAQCEDFLLSFITNSPTCYGVSDGSITANTTGGMGGTYFTITNMDEVTVNVGGSNTANTLPEGWYFIQAIDEEGCVLEDSIFLEQPEQMEVDLIITASNSDPDCDGSVIVETVYNYSGDFDLISYFWSPNPSGIDGVGADTIYSFCPGEHTLVVNDENGCSEVFHFVIGDLAGIEEALSTQIQFMANTVTGEITVTGNSFSNQLMLSFYEITGKLIYSFILNENVTILNPNFGSGAYIYTIENSNTTLETGKFVITK